VCGVERRGVSEERGRAMQLTLAVAAVSVVDPELCSRALVVTAARACWETPAPNSHTVRVTCVCWA
jgi:hypothetical protein